MNARIQNDHYLRTILDTLPSAVFVVDQEFKIFDLNPSATKLFGIKPDTILHRLSGEAMHCMHAMASNNCCGTTEYCPDCVIRNSIEAAFKSKATHKQKNKMKIQKNGDVSDIHMLVTASSFTYKEGAFVLLVLEDITEFISLQRLIPICSSCKKIRNDENYWEAVADYLRKHTDLEFTHGLCSECADNLYPHIKK